MLLGAGLVCFFLNIVNLAGTRWWNRYIALFTATLFCIHTANTETVNYISSRSSLLSTLAVIGAFLLYILLPSWRRFHLYLFPMLIGGFAKLLVIVFGPLLFFYILLFEQELSCREVFSSKCWPKVKRAILGALPACLAGLLLLLFIQAMNPSSINYGGSTRLEYLSTQFFVWLHYLRLFLVPSGLTADTDWGVFQHWYDTRFFAGLLAWSFWPESYGNAHRERSTGRLPLGSSGLDLPCCRLPASCHWQR